MVLLKSGPLHADHTAFIIANSVQYIFINSCHVSRVHGLDRIESRNVYPHVDDVSLAALILFPGSRVFLFSLKDIVLYFTQGQLGYVWIGLQYWGPGSRVRTLQCEFVRFGPFNNLIS